MPVITDYASLQSAITLFAKRNDVTTNVALLIQLAETDIVTDLDELVMGEKTVISPTVGGTSTILLPIDYGTTRRIIYAGTPTWDLVMRAPQQLYSMWPNQETGLPREYAILGGPTLGRFSIDMRPVPSGVFNINIQYVSVPVALATTPTNWLLTAFPNLYLYGALKHASAFSIADERIPLWEAAYAQAVHKAKRRSEDMAYPMNLQMVVTEGMTP